MKSNYQYDDFIRKSIFFNNEFGVKEIEEFEEFRSMCLVREDYPKIEALARMKDIESLRNLPASSIRTSEYISIMKFTDQRGEMYLVTSYDSDDLSQDPQVI